MRLRPARRWQMHAGATVRYADARFAETTAAAATSGSPRIQRAKPGEFLADELAGMLRDLARCPQPTPPPSTACSPLWFAAWMLTIPEPNNSAAPTCSPTCCLAGSLSTNLSTTTKTMKPPKSPTGWKPKTSMLTPANCSAPTCNPSMPTANPLRTGRARPARYNTQADQTAAEAPDRRRGALGE